MEQLMKKVAHKKVFDKGGGAQFTVLPMAPGSPHPGQDYQLFYFCDAWNEWLPVPCGFTVDKDAEPSQLDL
jgi:hypothetical protein